MTTQTPEQDRHYYYRPIADKLAGGLLKCAGFGAEKPEHRAFYLPYFGEGTVVLRGYHGDRITREYAAKHHID